MHRSALAEIFAYPGWANATEFRAKDLEFRDKFPPLPLIGIGQVNVPEPTFSFVTWGFIQKTNIFDCLLCVSVGMEIDKTLPPGLPAA